MIGDATRVVHFVVPEGIDDPSRTSGGNVFDRRVAAGLATRGWDVRMEQVDAGPAAEATLARLLSTFSGDLGRAAPVLIDGLVARRAPAVLETAAERLPIAVLAHMVGAAFPDADRQEVEGERRALRAAQYVIATSEWTRGVLVAREGIVPARIVVAVPGAAEAPVASGTAAGGALLCVGVVAPHKGQDVLIEALRTLDPNGPWTCTIAGSLAAFPSYADRICALAAGAGLGDRITMAGTLTEHELDDAYRGADLVVAPSRVESYGMAIADALRRGIPVVASTVGGIPQTVAGSGAAVLVPPGRPEALTEVLSRWMVDPGLRARLKDEALRTRSTLPRWSDTADRIAATLARMR